MMEGNKLLISAIVIINPSWSRDIELLPECLKTLKWVDEIVLVTSELTFELKKIAERYEAVLVKQRGGSFADWRNLGAEISKGRWLFYVDADERVSLKLKQEILNVVRGIELPNDCSPSTSQGLQAGSICAGYAIPRSNFILGREMRHAGWWPDYVLRLIKRDRLIEWRGDLHEQPELKGKVAYLENSLLHLKHQKLEAFVSKTIKWSDKEADLYLKAGQPRLNTWRFWRLTVHPFLTSFLNRYVMRRGFLDGVEGLIDAIYQSYSQFVSFAKVWEKQVVK